MTKIQDIYDAVDDYGLITSADAAKLGVSNVELVQQKEKGRLIRVERGVYRMPIWPSQKYAPYAIAVKAAGAGAYLYGESVIALLELTPTNPAKMWIGTSKRVRKNLGCGTRFVTDRTVKPVYYEGILCQPVDQAICCASAVVGKTRATQAAKNAYKQGYITKQALEKIEEELALHEKTE